MKHDIFLSYASAQIDIVTAICGTLEGHGFKCWMAPRDIAPGSEWTNALMEAILSSKMVLLLFSSHANGSPHVLRELQAAVDYKRPILTFRVDNTPPSLAMKYCMGTQHWFEAHERPFVEYMEKLSGVVGEILTATSEATLPMGSTDGDHLVEAKNRIRHRTGTTINRLKEQRRFRTDIYVNRLDLELVVGGFLAGDQPLLVLDGPPGSGKTSWMCDLAKQLLERDELTLFESFDRIRNRTFLDYLREAALIGGSAPEGAEARIRTGNGRLLHVVVDDLSINGGEEDALLSLLEWTEELEPGAPVKVIVSLRTERWSNFVSAHRSGVSWNLLRNVHMPPFEQSEILDLAKKIAVNARDGDPGLTSTRLSVGKTLSRELDASMRRPGFLVAVLESIQNEKSSSAFTPYEVYSQLYQRQILEMSEDGQVRKPIRGHVLRKIAEALIDISGYAIVIHHRTLQEVALIDARTGERTGDYAALTSNGILCEILEDFETKIAFSDMGLFEFVVALAYSLDDVATGVKKLLGKAEKFPPALTIAAFLVARYWRSTQLQPTVALLDSLGARERESLLNELMNVEANCFMAVFERESQLDATRALSQIETMLERGAPRLAIQAATVCAESSSGNEETLAQAQFLQARGYYEIDDYDSAERAMVVGALGAPVEHRLLRASISTARGKNEEARNRFESLLSEEAELTLSELARACGGLGYVLAQLGRSDMATETLQKAVSLFKALGDSKYLAESIADLGEIHGKMGRLTDARRCLEESLGINTRLGFVVGMGVAEGLMGDLDLREHKLSDAQTRLELSLRISRKVGNRWREAWLLKRLSVLNSELGNPDQAKQLEMQSEEILREIQ